MILHQNPPFPRLIEPLDRCYMQIQKNAVTISFFQPVVPTVEVRWVTKLDFVLKGFGKAIIGFIVPRKYNVTCFQIASTK